MLDSTYSVYNLIKRKRNEFTQKQPYTGSNYSKTPVHQQTEPPQIVKAVTPSPKRQSISNTRTPHAVLTGWGRDATQRGRIFSLY